MTLTFDGEGGGHYIPIALHCLFGLNSLEFCPCNRVIQLDIGNDQMAQT